MASLFTHALVALTAGQAGREGWRKQPRFWILLVLCSILPDIDIVGFYFGVRYGDLWGHRGMTHSLLFGATAACVTVAFLPSEQRGLRLVVLFFLVTASHGVLDALTNGGLGVAFFSPFNPQRYFFAWRPIDVSPISMARFLSPRGIAILQSEIVWVWTPCLILAFFITGWRWYRARKNEKKSQSMSSSA